jgi:hypothetical protein
MNLPMQTPLDGVVKKLTDTGKTFNANGGIQKRKYIIEFETGYVAEYCPPALNIPTFKKGDSITFKIYSRNGHGDEIEVLSVGESEKPALQASPSTASNMIGHPAVIALTVAKDMGQLRQWDPVQVRDQADEMLVWLLERRDLDTYLATRKF